jgi:hypothetical protein
MMYNEFINTFSGYLFVKSYGTPHVIKSTGKLQPTFRIVCTYENCNKEYDIIAANFKCNRPQRCIECANKIPLEIAIINKVKSDILTRIRRTKYKKLDFDLTDEIIRGLIFGPCMICGIYGSRNIKIHRGRSMLANSIDRIDSSIGYIEKNVQTLCVMHNFDKNAKCDKMYKKDMIKQSIFLIKGVLGENCFTKKALEKLKLIFE